MRYQAQITLSPFDHEDARVTKIARAVPEGTRVMKRCLDCGRPCSRRATRCRPCSNRHNRAAARGRPVPAGRKPKRGVPVAGLDGVLRPTWPRSRGSLGAPALRSTGAPSGPAIIGVCGASRTRACAAGA